MSRSTLRTIGTALCVCLAYYVGAQIGFALKLLPVTPSVLWPPNAILTAALLLAPTRRWWVYLLAAFPAHLAVQFEVIRPPSLMFALFVTNCSEALVAAAGVRYFTGWPTRFDTLPRVGGFLLWAGLVAPFVSSFADAGAVAGLRGEPYWLVWRSRFLSNVLAQLMLVPAFVMTITTDWDRVRRAPLRRHVEAALLAGGLVVVGIIVFAGPTEGPSAIPGSPQMPVAFLLPFTLWAAVRFGPRGAALSLLATALLAIGAGIHGRGPFTALPPMESVLALQVFLIVEAVPLMCLAALVEERRRGEEELEERLRFQELLSRLSGAFVHLPAHAMDQALETWLGRLGEFLHLDRITLRRFLDDQQTLTRSHAWAAAGSEPVPTLRVRRDFPWSVARLLDEQPVVFSRLADLPAEATTDRNSWHDMRVRSGLFLPLVAGGRVFGTMGLVSTHGHRAWPDDLVQRLRLVAEVFASSLARKEAEQALRESEAMKSAILASLSSSVAVLDREARIIAVNEGWLRYARDNGGAEAVEAAGGAGVGANYLALCREGALPGTPAASEALAGIEAVLSGAQPSFAFEYPCRMRTAERWFAMSVVPLDRPDGGAVVSLTDVTERRHAELEAQRSRQELAHFTRVSTMGELTASLAHELNQPLTGILANAQAARRFLSATPPDLEELRNILTDIIDDDKRAADVIHRLRDLLRKGEPEVRLIDLNALIRDVAKLLSSDAVIRDVTVVLALDPNPPLVRGDAVQLQQVVLNLLLNGMESMAECIDGDRPLVVQTENTGVQTAHVSVQDAGPGLRPGTQELIFEPFYTTKPAGMGMGLAIARTIIEAHGGLIWAMNNPSRGATFHFALPSAEPPA